MRLYRPGTRWKTALTSSIFGNLMLRCPKGLHRIFLYLEPWKPLLLSEEAGEGVVKVLKCVVKVLVCTLGGPGVDFLEPWVFFFEGRKTVVKVETGEFLTFLLVYPDLLPQRIVVHKPRVFL